MKLRNTGDRPIRVQVRAFRWSQENGREQLKRTPELIASPPFATVQPGREFTIRIVRVSRKPPSFEDSYRLLIDEIPDASRQQGLGVRFAVRYSLPVFFPSQRQTFKPLIWRAEAGRSEIHLTAFNQGDRRHRLNALRLKTHRGISIGQRNGLAGYVLARSMKKWSIPVRPGTKSMSSLMLQASSEHGPINVPLKLFPSR